MPPKKAGAEKVSLAPPAHIPSPKIAHDLVDFLNEAWTAYHAVEECKVRLEAAGFKELRERDEWSLRPGGKYYITRNMSTLVAFAIGNKYKAGNGFICVGAHTDSPCPKLKPSSQLTRHGFAQVNVQPYGGGLWFTWLDRDLSVAGRVIVRRKGGALVQELVKITRPILRIPTVAIHLDRTQNEKLAVNFQNHMPAVMATEVLQHADPILIDPKA